jgi:hypothetical protein
LIAVLSASISPFATLAAGTFGRIV